MFNLLHFKAIIINGVYLQAIIRIVMFISACLQNSMSAKTYSSSSSILA